MSSERYKELEDTNEALKKELVKLGRAQSDTERLVSVANLHLQAAILPKLLCNTYNLGVLSLV